MFNDKYLWFSFRRVKNIATGKANNHESSGNRVRV